MLGCAGPQRARDGGDRPWFCVLRESLTHSRPQLAAVHPVLPPGLQPRADRNRWWAACFILSMQTGSTTRE